MNMNPTMQRGQAAIQARDFPEALRWFRQAVAESPTDAQARACLGQTLCWLGQREAGLAELRQAGQRLLKKARKSRDIGLALGLTEQLQFWNDYPGALELGKQAVEINPAEVRGFQLLALSHARLNQKQAALAAGRRAARLAPESALLQILLASLEAAAKDYGPARQRLERALALAQRLAPEEKFRAHKELAAILDRQGEYGAVFPQLHAAAAMAGLLPEVRRQDRALVPGMLRANRDGFDRELLGRWSGADFRDEPPAPVFVLGFMRSGTTLTQEVLDAHPAVFVADETDTLVAVAEEMRRMTGPAGTDPERLRGLDIEGIKHLRRCYWERMRGRCGSRLDGKRLVDKTAMNLIDLGLINAVFPDAKALLVLRDPRDVILSGYMQTMIPTPSTVHLLDWRGAAEFYAQVMGWWLAVKPQLTMEVRELRYEDAVSGFEAAFRGVFEFLGLPWDPAVADFHRHAAGKAINSPSFGQVAQPLYGSSVARWKHYQAEFEPVAGTLRPFVEAFGYEA
jgi:Flp pilus assembly protein TadD